MNKVEQFIADSTEFFDNCVSQTGQSLSAGQVAPKFIRPGPRVEIDGRTYAWTVTLDFVETTVTNKSDNRFVTTDQIKLDNVDVPIRNTLVIQGDEYRGQAGVDKMFAEGFFDNMEE